MTLKPRRFIVSFCFHVVAIAPTFSHGLLSSVPQRSTEGLNRLWNEENRCVDFLAENLSALRAQSDATCTEMSGIMSRNRQRTYSFKRHRDALYAILEAAVTGRGAQEDDDVDVNSSGGGPSTVSRSREHNDGGQTSRETNEAYPSDFLWYEEMTPEDIDDYHAAHQGTPGSDAAAATADPPPLEHSGPPSTLSLRRDHHHGEHGCSETGDGSGNVDAGRDDEVVVAEEGQTPPPPPPPPALSPPLSTPLRPTPHASDTGKGKAVDPENSSQLAAVSSSETTQTPLIYSSCTSNDLPTAVECAGARISTATAAVEDGSLGEPSKRLRPSPQQEGPRPFDRAAGQEDRGVVATAVAAVAAAAAAATTALPITDSPVAHHTVGSRRRQPEAREKSRPATTIAPTTATAAAAATMTPTASEQSQATQSMFLPGLPSQLLVTQQQGDGGWDHVADEDLQKDDEEGGGGEEETAASEYALSLPAPQDENIDDVPTGGLPELAPNSRRGFDSGHASSQLDAGNARLLLPGGGSGGARVDEDFGPEIRARQNEGFPRVLRKFAGGSDCEQRGVTTGSVESARLGDGRGERSRQRLVLVPTQEVLPSGWLSGLAGVVGVLEDHLLRARERYSDGYTVRALELACQVFRQSSVCVRTGGLGEDNIGQGAVAVSRQMDSSCDAVALPACCDHAEVVGVTALVWEILREEIANQCSADVM